MTPLALNRPIPSANEAFDSGSPFHEGEQRVQTRLGVRDEIEPWARRVVRAYLPDEHREFYSRLPFLVLAARDSEGRPWATLLAEEPGFVSSPDAHTLEIAALPSSGDALAGALQAGDDIGILGIELATRRRNRVNGRVAGRDPYGLAFAVEQSFGNCPQYITERTWKRAPAHSTPKSAARSESLSNLQSELVRRADTFFIATGFRGEGESAVFGMDASHRGGAPGFIRVESTREIVFPDYAGNNHFNTLGNLELDPRAGLVFVDFARGDLLQLTGRARIDWGSDALDKFPGARRLVHFEIDEVVWLESALPIRFEAASDALRELRLISKQSESVDVSSFVFAAHDGGELPKAIAGQHLPVRLEIPGETSPVSRTYSISNDPENASYRISVKREPLGVASRFLHAQLEVGALISATAPQGTFTLAAARVRPIVFVSAGIGLTPLVSMLHSLSGDRDERPIWFVHGARDGVHHPLKREVEYLTEPRSHMTVHVAYSQPRSEDVLGRDYQSLGRIDGALLEELVQGLDADFYLCGPIGFMAAIERQLEERGVPTEQIYTESFGPAS